MIFFSSIIVSVALGATFFMFGAGQKFDDLLGRNAHPFLYKHLMNPQIDFWSNPDDGRLSGVVSEINEDQSFFVVDIEGKKWMVYFSKAPVERVIDIRVGSVLKFVGEKISDNEFEAEKIMPMDPGREFFNHHQMMPNDFDNNRPGGPDFRVIVIPR